MSLSVQSCGRAEGRHVQIGDQHPRSTVPSCSSRNDLPAQPASHLRHGRGRGSLNLSRPQFSHTKGEGPKLEVAFKGLKWNLVFTALAEANVWRGGQSHLDHHREVGTAPPSAQLSYGLKGPTHTCPPASHLPHTHR